MSSNAFAGKKSARGRLLRDTLRCALTLRRRPPGNQHFGRELRRMIRALARHNGISRQRQALPLRPFLQSRFRIDRHFRNGFRLILPQLVHDRARFLEAAVDEHRPEQRLGGVCEDRRLVSAAAVRLAVGKNEMGAKPDIAGNLGAGFAANEAIVAPGEFAFARIGVLPVQGLRDREPEDAIADELEAFVVEASNLPAADARMRERALQELRIL